MAPAKRKSGDGQGRKSSSKAARSGTPDLPSLTPQELEVGHMQIFQKWLFPVSKLLSSCCPLFVHIQISRCGGSISLSPNLKYLFCLELVCPGMKSLRSMTTWISASKQRLIPRT